MISMTTKVVANSANVAFEVTGEQYKRLWNAYVNWEKRSRRGASLLDFVDACIEFGVKVEEQDPNHVKNRYKDAIDPGFGGFQPKYEHFEPKNPNLTDLDAEEEENPHLERFSEESDEDAAARYYLGRLNKKFDYPYATPIEDWDVEDLAVLVGEVTWDMDLER